ncbi:MAG: DUF1573 domain-containing protein [Flavobacteriaceae bacterium]|nr:DUF1573 domain-containing protein [Flavobacteriaceae bacterium]
MKKVLLSLSIILAVGLQACKDDATAKVSDQNVEQAAERDAKAAKFPVMSFETKEHDFGVVNEGETVEHTFTFTNTGEAPLIVVDAKGSCGCTVPEWSKEPIAPGETGNMLVRFNTAGKPNQQVKNVNIKANTESGSEVIKIKAMVTPKAAPQA